VSGVESGISTHVDTVVSPRDVDRALAPLAVSSITESTARPGATPGAAPVTTLGTPTSAPAAPQTTASSGAPTTLPATTSPRPDTTDAPPPTVAVTTTVPPPTTTAGPAPTVIPTIGGSIAVTCPTPSTIRLLYAAPSPGYSYSPGEITPDHIHVKFTKNGQSVNIEAECSGGRVETSFEDDD
jgi:hypothetical protein